MRAIIDLKESNAAAIKGLLAAREAVETGDLYGATAQPGSLCGSSAVGAGVQVGAQAATDVRRDMRGKQIDYSSNPDARPLDYLERQLAEDHPDVKQMVEGMFPLDRTLTAEQLAQAHEAIKTLADPRPLPMPTDDQKENTAAGQTYAAARLVHQGRIQTAREALDHHVAFHAPTLPPEVAQWAVEQWKQAGAQGTPPGVVDGKMSEAALLNLLVQARAGNPNWYTQIASATEAGLLRALTEREDLKYVSDVPVGSCPDLAEKFGKRVFVTKKKMGAETAEANINAGLAAARQIVDFFKTGNCRFQVNK